MAKTFEEMLRAHARLPLYCLDLHKTPRRLFVGAEVEQNVTAFLAILVEEAYKMGTPYVDVSFFDPRIRRAQFKYAPEDKKLFVPEHISARARESIQPADAEDSDECGAYLRLDGQTQFGVYDDVDSKYPSGYRSAEFRAQEPATSMRMSGMMPWNLCCVASEPWAKKLGIGVEELWKLLFKVAGTDRDDPLEYLSQTMVALKRRRDKLNELRIKELHFENARGTDLKVGLSPKSKWCGGTKDTENGPEFIANWPTYEVFTTPDWRTVEGRMIFTLPSVIGSTVAKDLHVVFKKGDIKSIYGDESGYAAYRKLVTQDEGAKRLGEVALVGLDSPCSQLGRVMYETMIDENARCHVATGGAYTSALWDGPKLSKGELEAIGCNDSGTHHDVMISDDTTRVTAQTHAGNRVVLLEKGHWTKDFA